MASYTSPQGCRYNASLMEIMHQWTIDDVMDANEVLNLYDQTYELANAGTKK